MCHTAIKGNKKVVTERWDQTNIRKQKMAMRKEPKVGKRQREKLKRERKKEKKEAQPTTIVCHTLVLPVRKERQTRRVHKREPVK